MYPRLLRLSAILGIICLVGTLSACGQKGDLYLPDEPPAAEEEERR